MTPNPMATPHQIADRILSGEENALDHATLCHFLKDQDVHELMAAADRLRRAFFDNEVHLCSIVNAKQGGCPEDCGFCSQSKHFTTGIDAERFLTSEEIVDASEKAAGQYASALGLVTATRDLKPGSAALAKMVDAVKAVRDAGHTEAHASFGMLKKEAITELREAGLTELNHNLESGRNFFPNIVQSHSYDERIDTIKEAKAQGLRTCVGGIMGMGETVADRADLALTLRELDVDEVPINFLVSIEGTKLEGARPLEPMEMLRIIAAYRLALPRQNIFVAAGRDRLGQLLPLMFTAGASGMMVGDFLTTPNRGVADDMEMLAALGLRGHVCGEIRPEMARPSAQGRKSALRVLQ
jgi:biotin synthase